MKKLYSDGFGLIQTENSLAFSVMNEDGKQTYFQYNEENVYGISKESYIESMFGIQSKKIINQLLYPNIPHIESIAKCYIQEGEIFKLISLTEYYHVRFGSDWRTVYNFDWLPSDILSQITSLKICSIQDEIICLIWPHNIILHFNKSGELIQYILLGVTDYCDTFYQICSDGQAVWMVCPTMNTVVKYKFPSFKIDQSYHYTNEDKLDGLNYPEDISFIDGQLFICDMENERIVTFNPENGKIKTYISLDFKPFEFLKWKDQGVVVSNNGIYLL